MNRERRVEGEGRAFAVRLAELCYHAEGFIYQIPVDELRPPEPWIEGALVAEHSGDCTKHSWSCMRCHAEEAFQKASWVAKHLPQNEGVGS